jgi:hypothetical protein
MGPVRVVFYKKKLILFLPVISIFLVVLSIFLDGFEWNSIPKISPRCPLAVLSFPKFDAPKAIFDLRAQNVLTHRSDSRLPPRSS